MCAAIAGQRGRKVAVLEHNEQVGLKIGISGGGRCNFTNRHATPDNYLSSNPDFCKSALARYTPADFVALVEKHRIPYHEKKLGQLFCDESSRRIIAMLLAECAAAGVELHCGCRIEEVSRPERFAVRADQTTLVCDSLVVATGGLSFPKLGATDFGYRLARQFGLPSIGTRPGLVPLMFADADRAEFQPLSGVSLPVRVRHDRAAFEEAMLFTHRGLSGPAILQISSYWNEGDSLEFDLLPGRPALETLLSARETGATFPALFEGRWPRRFAEKWCARHAPARPIRHTKQRELTALAHLAHHWPLTFPRSEGYPKAEVTVGGVDTRELSSKTMEVRRVPGLYFIGEVVDVTGWLGGYNFQWAWASGHAAGEVA